MLNPKNTVASPDPGLKPCALLLCLAVLLVTPVSAQDTPPAEPSENEDRASFSIQLAPERGGGRLECAAGDFEYQEGEFLLATGGVTIKYRDLQLQADVARVDIPGNLMTAEGNVVLDEGPSRLVGETLEYNLDTRTGRITDATAYVESDYIFTGSEIAKVAEATYTLNDGVFTSCSEENPPWSIHMGRARVTLEDYARIKNARMKLGKMPVFYVPSMVWPTKTDRSSGLLIPQPGYSDRRGFELGLAYYKTLGRSADTTFYFDLASKEYFGFGTEVRYRPSENTEGFFELYALTDPGIEDLNAFLANPGDTPVPFDPEQLPDENRWKVNWFHETKGFWGGFRGVVNFRDFSDPVYRQDFERAVGRQTNSFIYSQAYLTRNFGQQSLNVMVDQRERIQTSVFIDPLDGSQRRQGRITDTRSQLPEIEYRLRPTQLGGAPVYFSLDGNLHALSIDNTIGSGALGKSTYGRADLFPSFSLPVSTLPWLSVKFDVGGRATYYTNTINPATGRFFNDESVDNPNDEDKSLTRTVGVAGAEVVGPSFSRIFEKKKPGRFSKLKHIVEPRFTYRYLDDFENEADGVATEPDGRAPAFDEIDRQRLRNETTVSFINRFLAKPTDEEEEGGAFEIASFELSQAFSLDDELPLQTGRDLEGVLQEAKEGPMRAILRFNPSQGTSLKAEAAYNTLFGQMQSASLSGSTDFGRHSLGGSLFTRWGSGEGADVSSNQARISAGLALLPEKLRLDAALSFDIEKSELLQQRYFIDYQGSCYNLRFELRESTFSDLTDRDFRFSFTLRNVGTFIDLNGSLD